MTMYTLRMYVTIHKLSDIINVSNFFTMFGVLGMLFLELVFFLNKYLFRNNTFREMNELDVLMKGPLCIVHTILEVSIPNRLRFGQLYEICLIVCWLNYCKISRHLRNTHSAIRM